MNRLLVSSIMIFMAWVVALAQPEIPPQEHAEPFLSVPVDIGIEIASLLPEALLPELDQAGDKSDPGYEAYKKGYDYILDEHWEKAIKQFEAMIAQYPKSQYIDDASYWIAYAYKNTNSKKAKELYKKFIKTYPHSTYYDDAVADMSELEDNIIFSITGDSQHVVISQGKGNVYTLSTGTTKKLAQQQYRMAQRMMNKGVLNKYWMKSSGVLSKGWVPQAWTLKEEHLDKETQLKLDALNALGDKKDDEVAYTTLKEIAIDPKQNQTLRLAALDQLIDFKKHDPLPVLVEIAKRDTSEDIQNLAINYIGSFSSNKDRSVETLTELFSAIPAYRTSQLQTILGSVAEVGNDKAVDFLGTVARSHENYDLRSDAIYYLGSIGSDRARTVLLEIIKLKK